MKTILAISLVVASLIQSHAQGFGQTPTPAAAATQPSAGSGFAAGLLSEEGEGDLAAAAAAYRQTIQEFDRQRDEAANAIFRLGEVYRKLGRMEEAKVQYARILREFPDMIRLTEISHNLLFGEVPKSTGGGGGDLQDRLQGILSSGMGGGGGGGGGMAGGFGSGGMGAGGMPVAGAAPTADADKSAGYVDEELSARYGTTIMRRPGTKPQPAESGAEATPGGSESADPRYSERIMMQRYGIRSSTGEKAERIACVNNLRQLGLAARIYSTDHEGVFPSGIGLMSDEIVHTKVLVCPSDPSNQPATSWSEFNPRLHMTYEFPGASGREDEPQRILFRCPIHGNVALGDGSVQQGQYQQSAVTPQHDEILRQRYGLGGAGGTAGTPAGGASSWDSIERVPKEVDREIKLVATLTISFLRDGGLTLNGGPTDLEAVTQLIRQVPDEMRALTFIELQADPETDFSRIGAVLDACQEVRVLSIELGAGTRAAIGQEIERLKNEYKSLGTDLSSTQHEAPTLMRNLDPFRPAIDQARARQTLAQERLQALSFPADRLPAVVGQDARYQRLKAEFETAVLDGDKAAQERTRARLQEWVDVIYRPELESEAELADRRLAVSEAQAQEFLRKQQAMQAQREELQGKLTASAERMNRLTTLLNQTQ